LSNDNGCPDALNKITLAKDNIAPTSGVQASASNDQDAVPVDEPYGRLPPRLDLLSSTPYFINSPYPGWTPPWGDYTPYQGTHPMNLPVPISKLSISERIHGLIVP